MKKLTLFLILSFLILSVSNGQEIQLTSKFDTSRIYIGDQINYTIVVDQPSDIKLSLPILKDTLSKNIEILSGPIIDSLFIGDERLKIIEKYLITSFDTGYYQIRPLFIELKNENGLKRFYSDYAQLEVIRVSIAPADSTEKIFDIIAPYHAPVTIGEILPWVLLVLLAAIIIWAIIRYLPRLKRKKDGVEKIIDPDPAHIIALRELEILREAQLWQKGETKSYYTRLTEILRQYLENRFNVYSLELTTSETLDELIKSGFKKDSSFKLLKSILTGADMVKFAKYNPDPSENEEHFKNSWDFVIATKFEEIIPETTVDTDKTEEEEK